MISFNLKSIQIISANHLVNYYKKSSVYHDEISEWILAFKSGIPKYVKFWSEAVCKDIGSSVGSQYVLCPIGHKDAKISTSSPLYQLCTQIQVECGIQFIPESIHKVSTHTPLKYLNAAERSEELKGKYIFSNNGYKEDASFLIIDDVVTTGSTAFAVAGAILTELPKASVHFYAISRTTNPDFGGLPKNDMSLYKLYKEKLENKPLIFSDSMVYSGGKRTQKIHSVELNLEFTDSSREQLQKMFIDLNDGGLSTDPNTIYEYLIPGEKYDFYLQNLGLDRYNETTIQLILASDTDSDENTNLISKIGQKSLQITGVNKDDCYLVLGIRLAPSVVGTFSSRSLRSEISFRRDFRFNRGTFSKTLAQQVKLLPEMRKRRTEVEERLESWKIYLDIVEKRARGKQFTVKYSGYKFGSSLKYITFSLSERLIDWELLSKSRNERVDIFQGDTPDLDNQLFKKLGTIERVSQNSKTLKIAISEEFEDKITDGVINFPKTGIISCSRAGDISEAKRLKEGLNRLKHGTTENPNLDNFIFDSTSAKIPEKDQIISLDEHNMLMQGFRKNKFQVAAVEGALSAPDMFLIQGPPGTGKTTVIAEICYQVAIRGGKTLIASQSNLAVDNALSKLVQDPKIRAIRKGNISSVEQEGIPFTEEKVINTWLENTANRCEANLDDAIKQLSQFRALENELPEHAELVGRYLKYSGELTEKNQALRSAQYALKEKADILKYLKEYCGQIVTEMPSNSKKFTSYQLQFDGSKILNDELTRYNQGIDKSKVLRRKIKDLEFIKEQFDAFTRRLTALHTIIDKPQNILSQTDFVEFLSLDDIPEVNVVSKKVKVLKKRTPGFFRRLFKLTKSWESDVVELLNEVNQCSKSLVRIIKETRDQMDESSAALGKHASAFKKMRALIGERYKKLAFDASSTVNQIVNEIDQTRKTLDELGKKINSFRKQVPHEYHERLPGIKSTAPDLVGVYKSIWKKEKENLEAYVRLSQTWIKSIRGVDPDQHKSLKKLYIDNANVFGITCSQSGTRQFQMNYPTFDVVIIDEVSKATPPELLLPALRGKKLVLIGDHKQLPPLLDNQTLKEYAESAGLEANSLESMLFRELFEAAPEELKQTLNIQYRMHDSIMATINQFYDGQLTCGIEDPDKERQHYCQNEFIKKENHILWYDVPLIQKNWETDHSPSFSNTTEVAVIIKVLKDINQGFSKLRGYPEEKKDIGIITFYNQQVKLLRSEIETNMESFSALDIKIGSVDRFQGMEKSIIIASFVRNNSRHNIGFAKEPERINVAMSRARELLIVVGCSELFSKARSGAGMIYSNILDTIDKKGGYRDVSEFV